MTAMSYLKIGTRHGSKQVQQTREVSKSDYTLQICAKGVFT